MTIVIRAIFFSQMPHIQKRRKTQLYVLIIRNNDNFKRYKLLQIFRWFYPPLSPTRPNNNNNIATTPSSQSVLYNPWHIWETITSWYCACVNSNNVRFGLSRAWFTELITSALTTYVIQRLYCNSFPAVYLMCNLWYIAPCEHLMPSKNANFFS